MDDMITAINHTKSSVSQNNHLQRYEEWNKSLGSQS